MLAAAGGPSLYSARGAAPGGAAPADELSNDFLSSNASGVPDAPADDLLQRMHSLLHMHTKQLNDMRSTLSDSTSEAFRDDQTAVRINMEPHDSIPILNVSLTRCTHA